MILVLPVPYWSLLYHYVLHLDFCWTYRCPEVLPYTSAQWVSWALPPCLTLAQPCCITWPHNATCHLTLWTPTSRNPDSHYFGAPLGSCLGWARTWYGHTTFDYIFEPLASFWETRVIAVSVFTTKVLISYCCILTFATEFPVLIHVSVCHIEAHALLFCLLVLLPDTQSRPQAASSWL